MGGDYFKYRSTYSGFSRDVSLTASAVATTALETVKSAKHQIYVQKVTLSITTHVDGKDFALQSSNATPVVIAARLDDAEGDATAAADVTVWDFGPEGTPVAVGESLHYLSNTGGSGFVGRLHVEGYQKLIGPVTVAQAASGG